MLSCHAFTFEFTCMSNSCMSKTLDSVGLDWTRLKFMFCVATFSDEAPSEQLFLAYQGCQVQITLQTHTPQV